MSTIPKLRKKALIDNIHNGSLKLPLVAIAGNPNVGKSTIFNALTGLNRHTGNWNGKTVSNAIGEVHSDTYDFLLADVPGTYSLIARSSEEKLARDFICFGKCDGIISVCDAGCLERGLNLVLQIAEYTPKITVCLNLIDEAKKKGVRYDTDKLSRILGLEVANCCAKRKSGLDDLIIKNRKTLDSNNTKRYIINYPEEIERAISYISESFDLSKTTDFPTRYTALRLLSGDMVAVNELEKLYGISIIDRKETQSATNIAFEYLNSKGIIKESVSDIIVQSIYDCTEKICRECIVDYGVGYKKADRVIDKIITGKYSAYPVMLMMLSILLWITIEGANYPSRMLSDFLLSAGESIYDFLINIGIPMVACELFINGVYRVVAWVVSVMLPPMAIFFPLFTLLEDSGVLPRIAYNLDACFARCDACGKQALTMCMGFGCNAAGVTGCRIIDSKREQLIAILTNNFMPCNGRFPILITVISLFFISSSSKTGSIISAVFLALLIAFSVATTLIVSLVLSKTLLKGTPSAFTLELPPYRKPKFISIIIRSFLDRTLFVMGRAIISSIPAGIIIWALANISVHENTLLSICTSYLDPFASVFGLDGTILMAFILGLPANETVIPIMIMAYSTGSSLIQISPENLHLLLTQNGWTGITAICVMLFTIMHWPCATTILTIKKETGSVKWCALSIIIPTLCGLLTCFIFANTAGLLGICA